MTAEAFSSTVLWLSSLAVPALVFITVEAKAPLRARLSAAALAIAAGWCLDVAYAVAAKAIALSLATHEQQLAIFDRDGAPLAFAATLGWVPALVLVACIWVAREARRLMWRRSRA